MNKNTEQLHKILTELGLSENEASVYLGALSLGNSRISEIAVKSGLKRTTVYAVVSSLKRKGLLAEHIRGVKKSYSASSPEMLEVLHTSKLTLLREAFPLFETLKASDNSVKSVVFLEGKAAVKSIYEETMTDAKPNDFYYALTDVEKWRNMDPTYFDQFIKRRVKKNLNMRLLFTNTKQAEQRKQKSKALNELVRLLPKGYELDANLVITPKRIIMHQTTSPTLAVSLENSAFIEIHKLMFEMLWENTGN